MRPSVSSRSRLLDLTGVLLAFVACGSPPPAAAPPPASAAPAASTPPPVTSAPPPAAPVASAPASTPAPAPAPAPPAPAPADDNGPGRAQKAIDIITARDAAFLIDYANSDAKQRAAETCGKDQDPERARACEDKAREAFQGDVIRFKRGPDDKKDWEKSVQLLIYKRSGSALREVSVGTVELVPETDDAVRVKLGHQKGARPLWRGESTALIKAPNDYTIEFDDPEYGHLRYDAKIGLVTD